MVSRNTLVINAAASLPGMQADTYMNGVVANQTIDGRDWLRTDSNGGSPNGLGPMRYGITTQPGIQTAEPTRRPPSSCSPRLVDSGW